MAEKGTQDPTTGTESDISKAQAQQQPQQESKQPPESGELETGEAEAGQPDEGLQGDTLAQQRTDVEGASLQPEKGEAESGFVGAEGQQDTSGEFVEKQDDDEDEEELKPEGE